MKPSDQEITEGLKISVVNYFLTHYGRILSNAGFPTQALSQDDILSIGEVQLGQQDDKHGSFKFVVNFRVKNHKATYQGVVKNNSNKDIENESVSGGLTETSKDR
jgi:hypothetical protein